MNPIRHINFKRYLREVYTDATGIHHHYEPARAARIKSVVRGNARMQQTLAANKLFDRLMKGGKA